MARRKVIFEAKEDLNWMFTYTDLNTIKRLWKKGRSVISIARYLKRNEHEIFLALYEMWMDGSIENIGRAFIKPNFLLVPGKDQIKRKEGAACTQKHSNNTWKITS